jgi:hypothetical protein
MTPTEQKTYCNAASAKQITFEKSGKTILKLSIKADAMIDFINQHKNEKGYLNLGISERREIGKYGETHTVWLDTWKPTKTTEQKAEENSSVKSDDVPF